MIALLTDLRAAVRQVLRQRLASAFAVVTLALGIGAVVAIWSVVQAVLLRPLVAAVGGALGVCGAFWTVKPLAATARRLVVLLVAPVTATVVECADRREPPASPGAATAARPTAVVLGNRRLENARVRASA